MKRRLLLTIAVLFKIMPIFAASQLDTMHYQSIESIINGKTTHYRQSGLIITDSSGWIITNSQSDKPINILRMPNSQTGNEITGPVTLPEGNLIAIREWYNNLEIQNEKQAVSIEVDTEMMLTKDGSKIHKTLFIVFDGSNSQHRHIIENPAKDKKHTTALTHSSEHNDRSSGTSSKSTYNIEDSGVNLPDRKIVGRLPLPRYNEDIEGRIIVNIVVDSWGNVVRASISMQGTTILNEALQKETIKAAHMAKFSESDLPEQSGSITYVFKLK